MFSRRLLRIKVLQILYGYHKAEGKTYVQSEKELIFSINKSYELYHYLMLLLIEVADHARSRMEIARQKKMPTYEDLNPNTRFIDNRFIHQLEENPDLTRMVETKKLSWTDDREIIRGLYELISESEIFHAYMSDEASGYNEDKKFVLKVLSEIIYNYEGLYNLLEEKSIFWVDDIDFIIQMIVKTLRKFNEHKISQLLPMFKDKEDLEFVTKLLRKSILHAEDNNKLIEVSAKNWELDRIAFIDILIMQMAITEAIEFQSIPIKVTMNEYIEISKVFSTKKSSQFINGILDNVFNNLKKEKKINKTGRGLIGD
ncbi:MAG: transcription antitermination factor NusB [Bacteroidales bacterium]|nr:transcription antitermination factor NusB [Bacteroidales bacterium]